MFTTLLAIINPLEALPVFLKLLEGKDAAEQRRVARLSCFYATLLAFFFLFFGKLILWIFGVPLSMVRIVGGIILMRIGFDLFSPSSAGASMTSVAAGSGEENTDVAFVPLAMPIMFGPGAIATILGMTSLVKQSEFELVSMFAICVSLSTPITVSRQSVPKQPPSSVPPRRSFRPKGFESKSGAHLASTRATIWR